MEEKKRSRNEDPNKVYQRQLKYNEKIEEIRITPLKKSTKKRYLKIKKSLNLTHDEFANLLLDKFEAKF